MKRSLFPLLLAVILLPGCGWFSNSIGEENGPCAENGACRQGLVCLDGTCLKITCPASCDDGNACTEDSCDAKTGQCQHLDISSSCDDHDPCTDDSCDPASGCVHANNGTCPGTSLAGDPCPYGRTVNGKASNCVAGLVCLGVSADGQSGTCTTSGAECTGIPSHWNPDCVAGKCSASFCADTCTMSGTCDPGFVKTLLGDPAVCFCEPLPLGSSCDPLQQIGCLDTQNCVPDSGTATTCIPVGKIPDGQPCTGQPCGKGELCTGLKGHLTCNRLCDATAGFMGCADLNTYCISLDGIVRWGDCVPFVPCDLLKMGVECQSGEMCTIMDDHCSHFACVQSGGIATGQACLHLNDCTKGNLCMGTSASKCDKVCAYPDDGTCASPATCHTIMGCPTTIGVCY